MSKISVQFHAEPTETIAFINDCVKELNLHVVLITIQPAFTASLFDTSGDVLGNLPIYGANRVCLYINQPNTLAKNYLEFINRNPHCLSITVGKYCDDKLEESILATKTDNAEALKVWKMIVKKFKSLTLAGAWVINPNNGAKAFYKQHRYTEGAKKLFENGVKLVPSVGWNYYVLS